MPVLAEASAPGGVLGLLVSRKHQDFDLCSFPSQLKGFGVCSSPGEGEGVIDRCGALAELTFLTGLGLCHPRGAVSALGQHDQRGGGE